MAHLLMGLLQLAYEVQLSELELLDLGLKLGDVEPQRGDHVVVNRLLSNQVVNLKSDLERQRSDC